MSRVLSAPPAAVPHPPAPLATVGKGLELSVVIPCLNESATLGACLRELRAVLETFGRETGARSEIVVVDNGSSDGSAAIALAEGARLVSEERRGYGRALRRGVEAAGGRYVVFMDADGEHPPELVVPLYRETAWQGAALGIASRLRGTVEPGAMPFSHRWFGTPVLTFLINRLFGGSLTDCGSGLRCVRREWFLAHEHHAGGMEFASENLIRALRSKARVVEIAGGMRAGPPGRRPHLRRWADGARHLMFIFAECPSLFERAGLFCAVLGSVVQLAAALRGPVALPAGIEVLGPHTQGLALLGAALGTQLWLLGLYLFERSPGERPGRLARLLLRLPEERLFFSLLAVFLAGAAVLGAVILSSWQSGFSSLSAGRWLPGAVHFCVLAGQASLCLLAVHMARTRR